MSGTRFPFSAVVGNDDAKLALLLCAIDPAIGGVLLRGHKGSAKTTLARGLAGLLDPGAPFVDLPVGATEDRVAGSLDLRAALVEGEPRFLPGLLQAADGGVLYVDEVNLLPDHLVDLLLDVAATGVNRVEREGMSVEHPSRFVMVGSMNPEEGELRPQLLDRFGLAVEVVAESDPEVRAEAVTRRLAFDADPETAVLRWQTEEGSLRTRLSAARSRARAGAGPPTLATVRDAAARCAAAGAEGLRADIVVCRAAAALAAWEARAGTEPSDIDRVLPLALAHRRRRHPLDTLEPPRAPSRGMPTPPAAADPPPAGPEPAAASGGPEPAAASGGPGGPGDPRTAETGLTDGGAAEAGSSETGAANVAPPDVAPPVPPPSPALVADLERPRSKAGGDAGRRSPVRAGRGRLVGDRVPEGPPAGVAVGATLRAAARRHAESQNAGLRVRVQAGDVREAVREQRSANLVVMAVDASGSMGARRRMVTAKAAVLGLLVDAYQRRDRVALVTFRGDRAEVALRPTASIEVAGARLSELPTGGRTPLAEGIRVAADLAASAPDSLRPLLVLVSDGRATSAPGGASPWEAALGAATEARRRGLAAVVVDAEEGRERLGLAKHLAEAMGARYLTLAGLTGDQLAGTVSEMLVTS